jgi:MFS family permease
MPEVSNASWADLRRHGRLILLAMLVVLGGTVATYVSNYMTTFAITTLQLPATTAMAATVMVGLMTFTFALLGGWLCDRWGRKTLMIWPRVLASLIAYPAFLWMEARGDAIALLITSAVLAALGALSSAASLVAIPELLPGRIRALGMSVIYAVGVAIFGGSTQFVITWLIASSGSAAARTLPDGHWPACSTGHGADAGRTRAQAGALSKPRERTTPALRLPAPDCLPLAMPDWTSATPGKVPQRQPPSGKWLVLLPGRTAYRAGQ